MIVIPILSVRLKDEVYLAMEKFKEVDWSKVATNFFKKVLWEISEEIVEMSTKEWRKHLEIALTKGLKVDENLLLLAKSVLLSVPRYSVDVEDVQRIQSHGMIISHNIPHLVRNISEITYSQIITRYMSPFTGALRCDWEPIFVEKPFKMDEKLFEKLLDILERGSTEVKAAESQLLFSIETTSPFVFIDTPETFRQTLRKKKILNNFIPQLGFILKTSDSKEVKLQSLSFEDVTESVENVRLMIYASLSKIKNIMLNPELIRWMETPISSEMWSDIDEKIVFSRELASKHIRGTAVKIVLMENLPETMGSAVKEDLIMDIIKKAEDVLKKIVKIENDTLRVLIKGYK
ncbi:MAG: hypothetical protein ACTSYM_08465 [Candidatus Baldrarchaeia archaeon]